MILPISTREHRITELPNVDCLYVKFWQDRYHYPIVKYVREGDKWRLYKLRGWVDMVEEKTPATFDDDTLIWYLNNHIAMLAEKPMYRTDLFNLE